MKYVALRTPPRASENWADDQPIFDARTVYEPEPEPVRTGLLNADGTPLYRMPDPKKIGYL